jgi:hypothetical protein
MIPDYQPVQPYLGLMKIVFYNKKNPVGVTGDFFRGTPDGTMCPGIDSASENEYHGFFQG